MQATLETPSPSSPPPETDGDAFTSYVYSHQEPPVFPAGSMPRDAIWISTVDRCLLELWRASRGQDTDRFVDWRRTRGMLGNGVEDIVAAQFARAGLRFVRQESVRDSVLNLTGKLDFRVEFPPGSGRWELLEVKSTAVPLSVISKKIYPSYLTQVECYLRLTGYERGFILFYSLAPKELGTWLLVEIRRDESRWAAIVARIHTIRRALLAHVPPACECGECAP